MWPHSELASSPSLGRLLAAVGVVFGVGSWRERPAIAKGHKQLNNTSKASGRSVCLEQLTAPAKTGPDRALGFVVFAGTGKDIAPAHGTDLRNHRAGCQVCFVGVPLVRYLECRVSEV